MLNLSKDIHSLTEFKRNTTQFIEHLKQTKDPLVLTVDGKAALVVQDAESYQTLLEAAELGSSVCVMQWRGVIRDEIFANCFRSRTS